MKVSFSWYVGFVFLSGCLLLGGCGSGGPLSSDFNTNSNSSGTYNNSNGSVDPGGATTPGPTAQANTKNGDSTDPGKVWQRNDKNTILSKVTVGNKQYLELKRLRVTVTIDGLRARTVIDHIYHNPFGSNLQGTFKYTLPANASVSYYGMYVGQDTQRQPNFFSDNSPGGRDVAGMGASKQAQRSPDKGWKNLRNARLVSAEKGRQVYEDVTRKKIDPALVEQVAPNTFSAKVFPIPADGYNRVIIAYEQTLPRLGDDQVYRFRFPSDVSGLVDVSVLFNDKRGKLKHHNLKDLSCNLPPGSAFVQCSWDKKEFDKDMELYFQSTSKTTSITAGTDPTDQKKYIFGQVKVEIPETSAGKGTEQAVFLLDTSLSGNPDLFAAQVKLLQKILEKNSSIQRFNVLFFDVGAIWAKQGWIPNTITERGNLQTKLNKLLLEGATDIASALLSLAKPSWKAQPGSAVDIFLLSDGNLNWGTRQLNHMVSRFHRNKVWGQTRFFAYQMSIVAENMPLYNRLTRDGGAVFACLGESELDKCATAHTRKAMLLQSVKVDGVGATEVMVAGRQTSLYPGAWLTFGARYTKDGPATIILQGTLDGKPTTLSYPVNVESSADLGPRGWAELTVAQLIELEQPSLEPLIVAYSQHFKIPNSYCSLLVLETDKEYKQYNLEENLKQQKVENVANFVQEQIKKQGEPLGSKERWLLTFEKGLAQVKLNNHAWGNSIMSMLSRQPDSAFEAPQLSFKKLWETGMVPKDYLTNRTKDANDFTSFTKEAQRRVKLADIPSAIRSLSSIVELHPSDPLALRLVGYYLMGWERASEAVQIFQQVLERRSYEPHSYRDVARALVKMKRFGLAAALYEIILAGNWDTRFKRLKTVVKEEYAFLIQNALKSQDTRTSVTEFLKNRKNVHRLSVKQVKFRVTVSWNTDNTDIDLWVIEPTGEKCFYGNKSTSNSGVLLDDVTQGYGPERYENFQGKAGKYQIKLDFYGNNSNILGNETHAHVKIVIHPGTSQQKVIEKNIVLHGEKTLVDVAEIELK